LAPFHLKDLPAVLLRQGVAFQLEGGAFLGCKFQDCVYFLLKIGKKSINLSVNIYKTVQRRKKIQQIFTKQQWFIRHKRTSGKNALV
jgi:hypothetical protein